MKKSILQHGDKACYVCGTPINLHLHHIFYGYANRKISDKDGCFVCLCRVHHTGSKGVHFNDELDTMLKQRCEKAWIEKNKATVEDFINRYGKNYL